ncbi:MAG: hypothetical protein PHW04_11500 [Candidatus Wallbacteria bacterium]|nr:hypothetical protein [Candidatus Wallbacteria bacterium]
MNFGVKVCFAVLFFALFSTSKVFADTATAGQDRIQVVFEDKDFQLLQQIADVYKKLPAEVKEKLKPILQQIKGALEKAAAAGIMKKADVDKIIAMFQGKSLDFDSSHADRVQIVLDDKDFAKIQMVADIYQKLPADAKEKLKPALECIKGALLKAAEAGVLKKADVDKIIAMFSGKSLDDVERLQIIMEQKDFDFLQKLASLYTLLPDSAKQQIKPYLDKAKEILNKAVAAGIMKKDDVDKILKLFNLKDGVHSVTEWLTNLINRIVSIFDLQKTMVGRSDVEDAQIDALVAEMESCTDEMVNRLQILLDQKDFDNLQKAAAVYTLLPNDIKDKVKPVMEQVKQALLSAAKAGVLKQADVDKILKMFNL